MGLPATLFEQPAALELIEAGVELVPVPAAYVIREQEGFRTFAANVAFRQAGLGGGTDLLDGELGLHIDKFIRSDELRSEFAWKQGEVIDCRHYRVTLARNVIGYGDRCMVSLVDQTAQVQTERSLRREMCWIYGRKHWKNMMR